MVYQRHGFVWRPVDEGRRDEFDGFIAGAPHGDLLQSYAWGELKRSQGWTPFRFLIEDRGAHGFGRATGGAGPAGGGDATLTGCTPRGAATVLERRVPGSPWTFLYLPRGPILEPTDWPAVVFFREALARWARGRRAIFAKLDPAIPEPAGAGRARRILALHGFVPVPSGDHMGGTQPRAVCRLSLEAPLARLYDNMRRDARNRIRRAEKAGFVVREGTGADLPLFHALLAGTGQRKRFAVRSLAYFEEMWRQLAPGGQLKLFIAENGQEALSAVLVGILGNRLWGLYQGTSERRREVGCSYLLLWHVITWAHGRGHVLFDLGGVPWRRDPEGGLEHFKLSLGAARVEFAGEHDMVFRPALYAAWRRGYALRRRRSTLHRKLWEKARLPGDAVHAQAGMAASGEKKRPRVRGRGGKPIGKLF